MTALDFAEHCTQISHQTDLLRAAIAEGDMTTAVPSCPGWNVGQLVRHTGGGQRWAAQIVRTKATEPPPDEFFRDLSPYAAEDAGELDGWLADAAARLSTALSAAGAGCPMWTPVPDAGIAAFYARRFANETLIHRADASLALGVRFDVEPEVGLDAIEEWLELASLPMMVRLKPQTRELLAAGRTIGLRATDADAWVVDLTGEHPDWRRGSEPCAVTVTGTLVELLLVIYRRLSTEHLDVRGEADLLRFWLARVAFG